VEQLFLIVGHLGFKNLSCAIGIFNTGGAESTEGNIWTLLIVLLLLRVSCV
jgi:hypothetical protein